MQIDKLDYNLFFMSTKMWVVLKTEECNIIHVENAIHAGLHE